MINPRDRRRRRCGETGEKGVLVSKDARSTRGKLNQT